MGSIHDTVRALEDIHGDGETALPARAEAVQARTGFQDPTVISCRSCKYENRLSQSFFVLGIQHLYCRRCGRMIDRQGHPASGS